jgi:hypothetical protein
MRRAVFFAVIAIGSVIGSEIGLAICVVNGMNAAADRILADQAQHETRLEGSLETALSSRDMEIERLNVRVDEQWREFYETLEARQPVLPALNKGKTGVQ